MKANAPAALLFILLCCVAPCFAQQLLSAQPAGIIQGKVSDSVGGLEGIAIEITGTGGRFEASTNAEGLYKAKVPPGTYSVSIKPPEPDPAYRQFQRAKFRLAPNEVKIIDLSPYSGFDYCSSKGERIVNVRASGVTPVGYSTAKVPRYDKFPITTSAGGEMEVMIEFCQRKQRSNSIKYRSVVISFDETTIYAESATFYPRTLLLEVGNKEVQLVARDQHSTVSGLRASFSGGNVYFDFPDGYTSSVKGQGSMGKGEQSFEISVSRDFPVHFLYHDKLKGFTLRSNPNDFFSVKTVSPSVVILTGSGTLTGSVPRNAEGPYNFMVKLEAPPNALSTLTIEIPRLDYQHSAQIPSNAVTITREDELYDVADPVFKRNGVKTTSIAWP